LIPHPSCQTKKSIGFIWHVMDRDWYNPAREMIERPATPFTFGAMRYHLARQESQHLDLAALQAACLAVEYAQRASAWPSEGRTAGSGSGAPVPPHVLSCRGGCGMHRDRARRGLVMAGR
jgi:hypothetical protein